MIRLVRLGAVERRVLLTLAVRGACRRNDWAAWWPLNSSQVYGAIDRLGRKGLVDVAGFDGRSRTFRITAKGLQAVDGDQLEEEFEGEP